MIEFGVYLPQLTGSYETVLSVAHRAERLGFDSFWLFDHLHGPGLPEVPSLEGWTVATSLLAQTETLRVGHLVLCNNFRHPALLAKMATTLDVISGGRLELGIGSGSVEAEHTQAGLPWGSMEERSERLAEALEIITTMLASERTTFAGRHYRVDDLPNLPRPTQQPRPPIHVGGAGGRHTLPIVARYADVWNVPTYALGEWQRKVGVLEEHCERIGRDPAEIRRSHEAVLVLAADEAGVKRALADAERRYRPADVWGLHEGGYIGTPAHVTDRIGELVDQGISTFVFFVAARNAAETIELFSAEVMPSFRSAVVRRPS